MILLILLLLVICLYRVKFSSYHEDYMSLSTSNSIKGIFALIILFSHMGGYIELSNSISDRLYQAFLGHIGQLMVAMYFFYSGYGIMKSIQNKKDYYASFFKNRIIKTLVHFDIAVLFYIILMSGLQTYYPLHSYLTCWIGWDSVGNSNWFIFDILVLYLITYISLSFTKEKGILPILVSVFTIATWGLLWKMDKEPWWINTLLTFPTGMWFVLLEDKLIKITPPYLIYVNFSVLVFTALLWSIWYIYMGIDDFGFCSCLFCLLLVFLQTIVKVDNRILQWLGTHAFAIYIMQRFPMNLYRAFGWNENPYLFALFAIPSVLIIASGFNYILKRFDKIWLSK